MPMQLGPSRRMPTRRVVARSSASIRFPSSSPVSEKPAVKRWSTLTPLAPHSSASFRVIGAGIIDMVWSTGPGTSSMLG